ncbi:hypothetical protein KSF_105050 [Reticulibacter mediterranei]|uniref:DUF7779 domain-containing protein n=1 Tax=Reticulibacter mediterranei TaxID=2778369 RepID=A0A8J3NAK6_9CHLR|nr:tetratricopeptide repeat-containing protein [Reticulibacter mediterranei]GHP00458.1 hypothetical protein KSF_105050 [Reticulibacter mediterranei]
MQEYLHLSQEQQYALLARRGKHTVGYADSVATTWSLSFEQIEQSNQAAAEFLQLCAFVAPDQFPEEVLIQGASFWPAALQEAVSDRWRFNQLLETVQAFSLVQRFGEERLLRLHRLVQVVQQAHMDKRDQKQWAERLVQAVHALLPTDARVEIESWPQCQRVVEQAKNCDQLIRQYGLQQEEAIALLERAGIYLRERGSFAQAKQLLLHALCLHEQQGTPQVLPMTTLLLNLANLSSQRGKDQEAEAFCQRALQIRQHHLGPEHLDVALALHWLVNIVANRGRLKQAERLYAQALQIREEQSGPEHPLVATSLLGLSLVYERQKQYTQAEALTMRTLRIREQQFGSDHPQTILAINGLAVIYAHQGKDEQAEPLYLRSLHIQECLLGADHPQLGSPLDGLARIYAHQGKDEQAELFYLRAIHILEQQSLTEHLHLTFPITGKRSFIEQQDPIAFASQKQSN